MTTSSPPQLPVELITQIISSIPTKDSPTPTKDLASTWLTCRLVSQTWKSITEAVFMKDHLPKLGIFFDFSNVYSYTSGHGKVFPDLTFALDRFSPDGERMIMKVHKHISGSPEWIWEVKKLWGDEMSNYLSKEDEDAYLGIRKPCHIISLGSLVRDSELPEMEYDTNNLSLSFKWKHMLSLLFGEEMYTNKLLDAHGYVNHNLLPQGPMSDQLKLKLAIERAEKPETREFEKAKEDIGVKVRDRRYRIWWKRHYGSDEPDPDCDAWDIEWRHRLSYRKVAAFGRVLAWKELSSEAEGGDDEAQELAAVFSDLAESMHIAAVLGFALAVGCDDP